ncbi:urotensin-related peptide 1 [Callorhinchus milii]|uniref:urotensin-related peptide 1 n=1 Tax=Callorhinchus milii TaxID=7868 RepID=UPI001C3F743D|nr:urotensin-related peptide 1 [Callorhinchus milii]
MYSWTFVCVLAILSGTSRVQALLVFPENSLMQREFDPRVVKDAMGFMPNDISSVEGPRMSDFYSSLSKGEDVLLDVEEGARRKANAEGFRVSGNLVDDMNVLLWKLGAAQHLQNRRFKKSDQVAQKSSKRTCFWKYCVTN